MTLNEYQALAMRTSPRDGHDKLDNAMLGLIGETGEIVDAYKKHIYQSLPGAPFPAQKIAEELGDTLWYMAELADGLEARLGDIVGNRFGPIDTEARRRGGATTNPRRAIMKLHHRADMLCLAIEKKAWRRASMDMRMMIHCAARLAHLCGHSLEEIARANIDKLIARYPDGFDARASMRRYE